MSPQISKLFSINHMLKPSQQIGPLPSSKSMYQSFFKVAWPSAIETLLVGLVASVDTMMVGDLGPNAIAAVGITNQPKFILLAMIFSLNVGITAVVARRKGAGDQNQANHTLRVGILLSAIISLIMGVIGFVFASPILKFSGAATDYLADAITYFRIIMVSILFSGLNLTINAAQRGSGNTKIAMRTNIISNVVNVIFNYLLINGIWIFPRLEVAGAAIATCLGAIVAFLISFSTLFNKNNFLTLRNNLSWKISKDILYPIYKVSGSSFVEQVFMRIGFFAYALIVARLGTSAYATHIICMNILNFSFCFGDGLAIAASSLVGQSLGTKRPDLSIIYGKIGQRLSFIISSFLFVVFILGREYFVTLFSDSPEVISLGGIILIIIAFTTHAQTSQVVISGCLRGAGDSGFIATTSLLSVGIIRPLLTYILCFTLGLGLPGAWIALTMDQLIRLLLNSLRFSSGKWAKIVL